MPCCRNVTHDFRYDFQTELSLTDPGRGRGNEREFSIKWMALGGLSAG